MESSKSLDECRTCGHCRFDHTGLKGDVTHCFMKECFCERFVEPLPPRSYAARVLDYAILFGVIGLVVWLAWMSLSVRPQ